MNNHAREAAGILNALARVMQRPLARKALRFAKRVTVGSTLPDFVDVADRFAAKRALEIGGPSAIFRRGYELPIYPIVGSIDGTNFGTETVWEGSLADRQPYPFDPSRAPGTQFISEAAELTFASDASYDVIASSHCLEHVANPIKALREWRRVCKPGGSMLLVLPDPHLNFDRRRPVTTMAHLLDDDARNIGEDDLTHLPEILALHDLSLDPAAGTLAQFEARSRLNLQNRCLHQHVFSPALATQMVTHAGWHHIWTASVDQLHIIVLADAPK